MTKDDIQVIINLYKNINGNESLNNVNINELITNTNRLIQLQNDVAEYIGILKIQLNDAYLNQHNLKNFNSASGLITVLTKQLKILEKIIKEKQNNVYKSKK